jgi:hypothetical protein
MERSPDELIAQIERGNSMRAALENPAFLEAVEHLTTYHLSALVACRPGYAQDQEALTHHHTMHHAITEILAQMAQWMETGEATARALQWDRDHGEDD